MKVKMRTGRAAGIAELSNLLSACYAVACLDRDASCLEVSIEGAPPIAEVQDEEGRDYRLLAEMRTEAKREALEARG